MIISCPNWAEISKNARKGLADGSVPMTPEVAHFQRSYTPKSNRSDRVRHEGGAILDGEIFDEPQFDKIKISDDFAIG